jgi:glutamine synthetase
MVLMTNRYILPAGFRYQGQLAESVSAVKTAGGAAKETRRTLDQVTALVDDMKSKVDKLQQLLDHEANGDADKHARYFRDKIVPAMNGLRETGDALEGLVPQDLWPLPTYREMLFVK